MAWPRPLEPVPGKCTASDAAVAGAARGAVEPGDVCGQPLWSMVGGRLCVVVWWRWCWCWLVLVLMQMQVVVGVGLCHDLAGPWESRESRGSDAMRLLWVVAMVGCYAVAIEGDIRCWWPSRQLPYPHRLALYPPSLTLSFCRSPLPCPAHSHRRTVHATANAAVSHVALPFPIHVPSLSLPCHSLAR